MILNHQNLPANHQILQVALQAAEQQLLIWPWREQLQFIGSCVVYKPSNGRSYELPVRC